MASRLASNGVMQNDNKAVESNDGRSSLDERQIVYMHGPRFWLVSSLLGLMFFLVSMEISVVTTSLVAISTALGGFEDSSWVLSSYLLGYVGAVVLVAKLSDIFGRRPIFALCIAVFTIFSGGCGAAQSLTQLIVLRAFQGLGGGGCFAMNTIFMIEMVPPHKYGQYISTLGIPAALALGLGPVIGGAISSNTTWRWVFLINAPVGFTAFIMAFFAIPRDFPFKKEDNTPTEKPNHASKPLKATLARLDLYGSALLVLATVSLTAAFEEAGLLFPWRSAYVIALLTASGVLWVLLGLWERHVTRSSSLREPILPWSFLKDRIIAGILLGSLLLGGPMTATVFILPQRFQVLNGLSSFDAGVRLVPFGASLPIGTILGTTACGKFRAPSIFVAMTGAVLQVIGLTLLSTLSNDLAVSSSVYGYEVLCGIGCGITYQVLYLLVPLVTTQRDRAVGMGAVTQFRLMGGAIWLSIATSLFNGAILPSLGTTGTSMPDPLSSGGSALFTESLSDPSIRDALSEGYRRQMLLLAAVAALETLSTLLLWKRPHIRLPRKS